MNAQRHTRISPGSVRSISMAALFVAVLSGCHESVTYSYEHEDATQSIADFETEFLVHTALTPYALTATSIDMIANPDAFLTPRSRSLTRHHVPVETTSTYLLDSGPCDFGGETRLEATGETETYEDSTTFISMDAIASADACQTQNWQGYVTLDSRLEFDVMGWYDDLAGKIMSLEGVMTGHIRLTGDRTDVKFSHVDSDIIELSATDFRIHTDASVWMDDGWLAKSASLSTPQGVHWYQGDSFPHAGKVRLSGHRDWVELSFSSSGVSRNDSRGNRQYWSWSSLD